MSGDLPPPDPSQRNHYEPEPQYASGPPSYDRLRRTLIAVGGVAMVVFAIGLGLVVLRDSGDGSRPNSSAGTAPANVTEPTAPPRTEGPTSAASAAAVPSSAPVPTTAATAGTSTVPSAAPTTAVTVTSPTTAAAAPPALTPAPDPAVNVVATAQALLDVFADGRWNDARSLNPGRNESDAFLQTAYGPIVDATIIPAAVTPVSSGRYDVRFGIVSHENQPSGQQTVLMCSHWQVNVDAKTIVRVDSARLRVESGFVAPQTRANELSSVCASLPLK